jgi:pimeloyl-ACP methyl ester carboxylesterase
MVNPTLHHVERGGEDGTDVPLLALHGWWPDHRLMLGCLEPVFAVKRGYRRLYPDLPGMGATPAPSWFAGSDDVFAAVQGFVDDEIGEQPFLLVGESYGGYLARALTRARPEQVLGLALLCPAAILEPSERTVPPHQVLRADPGVFDGLEADFAEDFATMSVVQTPETVRRYRDEIAPGVAAADPQALERIRGGWALSRDPDADGQAPFERPTLILTGRQDDAVGYLDQWRLLPHYPRATFAVLDVAGHNLQIEQPELFTALMLEWLDRVGADGRMAPG